MTDEALTFKAVVDGKSVELVHGRTCRKAPHDNPSGGYLHGENDDTPYTDDGLRYCGRCHTFLGRSR